jgi:hypothetical protein
VAIQFVVQIANRPGSLAQLARALAVRGVNIEHIAGGGAGEFGYAILTTDDDEVTHDVLASMGVGFVEGAPLHVTVEDVPGALADLTERLAAEGIGIHGLLRLGTRDGRMELAVTVDDVEAARRVLGLD